MPYSSGECFITGTSHVAEGDSIAKENLGNSYPQSINCLSDHSPQGFLPGDYSDVVNTLSPVSLICSLNVVNDAIRIRVQLTFLA